MKITIEITKLKKILAHIVVIVVALGTASAIGWLIIHPFIEAYQKNGIGGVVALAVALVIIVFVLWLISKAFNWASKEIDEN